MTRKALLIGSPGTPGNDSYLPGVEKDLANFSTFFRSPLGGAWTSDEIKILRSPSSVEVAAELGALTRMDYSLVTFSGHGSHKGTPGSTYIELKPGTEVDSARLRYGALKHTLILDCCRVVSTTPLFEALAKATRSAPTLNATDCRRYFDKRISECASGLVVLHACSKNETAGETAIQGGYYSGALINVANDWLNASIVDTSKNIDIFSIVATHNNASTIVTTSSGGRQHPEIEKPRVEKYFPFAIIA